MSRGSEKITRCTYCVMDTTDPEISFDANGRCNHCRKAEEDLKIHYKPDERGAKELQQICEVIRKSGKGKPYDCILGLSGGVDSSWVAYKAREWGLRPLLFHVDAGWNSELAQQNIENIVKRLGLDLFTYVVDWEEMRDLHVAYLKSGLANQDVPQDHIFFSMLYKKVKDFDIRYWISGLNYVSESILPKSWGYSAMDPIQLKAIHKRFGKVAWKTYKSLSLLEYNKYYGSLRFFSKVHPVDPLNLIPYDIRQAKEILQSELGWQDYGKKHYESRFTKFFQSYYLPVRFGYDKRKAHLSSLIVSGQIRREDALKELEAPPYEEATIQEDKAFVLKKLGLNELEWEEIMAAPIRTYRDYPNAAWLLRAGESAIAMARQFGITDLIKSIFRKRD